MTRGDYSRLTEYPCHKLLRFRLKAPIKVKNFNSIYVTKNANTTFNLFLKVMLSLTKKNIANVSVFFLCLTNYYRKWRHAILGARTENCGILNNIHRLLRAKDAMLHWSVKYEIQWKQGRNKNKHKYLSLVRVVDC